MILYRDKIDVDEQPSAPTLPGAGTLNLYADSGGVVVQDAAGVTTELAGQIYPERVVLWGIMASDILAREQGATISISPYADQRHRLGSFTGLAIAGDVFGFSTALAAGDYTMQVLGVEFSVSGAMSFSVNGNVFATRSMYNAGTLYNAVYTVPMTLKHSGLQDIMIKNFSIPISGNENSYLAITKIVITKD